MKRFMLLFLIVSLFPLTVSARRPETSITRNEAQHLALSSYPGARVVAARLHHQAGHSVWRIELAGPQADQLVHLSVDAMSGRVLAAK